MLITANDYRLKFFNGDTGILLEDPETAALRAYFATEEGTFRNLLPARLSAFETAHAITVHKSQGSEFDQVLLVVPDRPSPVLTRELLYTAVTRARSRVEIWGSASVVEAAVEARLQRTSGLRDALWGALHAT